MSIDPYQVRSHYKPQNLPGKIIQFPLVRSLIAVLFIVPTVMLSGWLAAYVVRLAPESYVEYLRDILAIVRIVLLVYVYKLFTRIVEKRPAFEMFTVNAISETAWGIRIGAGLMTLMVGLLWVLSYYRVESLGPLAPVFHSLFMFGFLAFVEEVLFRIILFRHIEELLGSWGAIVVVGLLFGFMHAANENATLWTSLAIALQSLILAGTFMLTRSIWLVWGLHWGWNYFQSAIFGMTVSGANDFDSWFIPTVGGPEWLTGGDFGIEGSYLATFLCVLIGLLMIRKAGLRRHILKPMWTRNLPEPVTAEIDDFLWRTRSLRRRK